MFPRAGEPDGDIRAALFDWVETGRAPSALVATRGGEDLWLDPRVGAPVGARPPTRLVCAHPLRARWNGAGSPDEAANFTCEQHSTDP